jgi:hypothetical protein
VLHEAINSLIGLYSMLYARLHSEGNVSHFGKRTPEQVATLLV